ncbi:MAG: secretin N-terminal domain-containing protein [Chromatiales bacterium]|nr:secretin N-terminal domain-containing protein [Chromatiales bacterium]
MNNAPARQVLLSMVEGTPYSVVLPSDLSGAVSLTLKNTTVPEAMQALRHVYGYDFRRDGNRYFMHGRGIQTRMFPVNYLNFDRKGRSDTRVVTGELTQVGSTGSGSGTTGGTGPTGPQSGQQTQHPSGVRVETESKVDFWRRLQETLGVMLGCEVNQGVTQPGLPARVQGRPHDCGQCAGEPGGGARHAGRAAPHRRLSRPHPGHGKPAGGDRGQDHRGRTVRRLPDRHQLGRRSASVRPSARSAAVRCSIAPRWARATSRATPATSTRWRSAAPTPQSDGTAVRHHRLGVRRGVQPGDQDRATSPRSSSFIEVQGNVHVLSSPRVSTRSTTRRRCSRSAPTTSSSPASPPPPTTSAGGSDHRRRRSRCSRSSPASRSTSRRRSTTTANIILHIHPSVSEVTESTKLIVPRRSSATSTLPLAPAARCSETDTIVRVARRPASSPSAA